MTPEEAKLILSARRSDQIDPADAPAQEALQLVAAMPELAAWWQAEQAFDRAFARKLASIAPPRELHSAILRGGATIFAARNLISETTDADTSDAAGEGAADGREKVVPFYDANGNGLGEVAGTRPNPHWFRVALPWSLAASVALALLGFSMFFKAQKLEADAPDDLAGFTQYATKMEEGHTFPFNHSTKLEEMESDLAKNQAPHADKLPDRAGVTEIDGWSVVEWQHHRATEVRLHGDTTIDLFILARADFPREKEHAQPEVKLSGNYAVTIWTEGPNIYMLLTENPGAKPTGGNAAAKMNTPADANAAAVPAPDTQGTGSSADLPHRTPQPGATGAGN